MWQVHAPSWDKAKRIAAKKGRADDWEYIRERYGRLEKGLPTDAYYQTHPEMYDVPGLAAFGPDADNYSAKTSNPNVRRLTNAAEMLRTVAASGASFPAVFDVKRERFYLGLPTGYQNNRTEIASLISDTGGTPVGHFDFSVELTPEGDYCLFLDVGYPPPVEIMHKRGENYEDMEARHLKGLYRALYILRHKFSALDNTMVRYHALNDGRRTRLRKAMKLAKEGKIYRSLSHIVDLQKGISDDMSRKYPGGVWRTINGARVYIKKDGSIASETDPTKGKLSGGKADGGRAAKKKAEKPPKKNDKPSSAKKPKTGKPKDTGLLDKPDEKELDRFVADFRRHAESVKGKTFDDFVDPAVKKAGDDLLLSGSTGYNVGIKGRKTTAAQVGGQDYLDVLTKDGTISYHMYTQYPEHGEELLKLMRRAMPKLKYSMSTQASSVAWDEAWGRDPESEYVTLKDKDGNDKLIGRTMQYVIAFHPNDQKEAEAIANFLHLVAHKKSDKGIQHSWEVPDVRRAGAEKVDDYKERRLNYRKIGKQYLLSLSNSKPLGGDFKEAPIQIGPDLAQFIE